MGTTLLDRINPLDELRDTTPRAPSRGLNVLRALREETPELEDTPVPASWRTQVKRRITRRTPQPQTPPRLSPVRILRHYVQRGRHADPASLPPVYTPPMPLLRGAVNAAHNAFWGAWLAQWDRFLGLEHAALRAMAERDRVALTMPGMKAVAKLKRTTEYYTRAVWEDYLEAFGATSTLRARVVHDLTALELLAV